MKKLLVCLVSFLSGLTPLVVHSAWITSDGMPVKESENMQSNGNFAVMLLLTPDENQFRQTWNKNVGPPKLRSTDSVSLGSSISAMLLFHGCTPSPKGVCDVTSEFILEGPDKKKTPAGGGAVWSDAPMPVGVVQLGRVSMTAGFDSKEDLGSYKVIANVKDKISGRTLSVSTKLNVTNVERLPIKLGDTIEQVQKAYQTNIQAEPYSNNINKDGYELRLKSKGVWVFFNNEGKVRTIRLDAPYKGSIGGIKIGDTLQKMKTILGEPVSKPRELGRGIETRYRYHVDDKSSATFVIDRSGEVVRIFM